MTDARQKFAHGIERLALVLGDLVVVTVKHGHLDVEVRRRPSDPANGPAFLPMVEAVEIAMGHICPACGVDANIRQRLPIFSKVSWPVSAWAAASS
jgi:hypothetical protein